MSLVGDTENKLASLFQQKAFNAAAVVNHMKKDHLSELSSSPTSLPHIIVQSSSHNDLGTLGACHGDGELDPNGNPVHAGNHLTCSNPGSCKGVCPPLRARHSEPGNALTISDSADTTKLEGPFRTSKRWEGVVPFQCFIIRLIKLLTLIYVMWEMFCYKFQSK